MQIEEKLQKKQRENGVVPPSDITQALADQEVSTNDEEPTGFFGKYLKKHHDMKKKAEDEVLEE